MWEKTLFLWIFQILQNLSKQFPALEMAQKTKHIAFERPLWINDGFTTEELYLNVKSSGILLVIACFIKLYFGSLQNDSDFLELVLSDFACWAVSMSWLLDHEYEKIVWMVLSSKQICCKINNVQDIQSSYTRSALRSWLGTVYFLKRQFVYFDESKVK